MARPYLHPSTWISPSNWGIFFIAIVLGFALGFGAAWGYAEHVGLAVVAWVIIMTLASVALAMWSSYRSSASKFIYCGLHILALWTASGIGAYVGNLIAGDGDGLVMFVPIHVGFLLGALALLGWGAITSAASLSPLPRHLCPTCRYDLRGLTPTASRCPECGNTVRAQPPEPPSP